MYMYSVYMYTVLLPNQERVLTVGEHCTTANYPAMDSAKLLLYQQASSQ